MIPALLAFNFLFMILFPLVLARKFARQYQVGWGLFGMGAVAFVFSQVGHISFNWLLVTRLELFGDSSLLIFSVFLGLSAGTFEGMARYLTFRFWATKARTWSDGFMVGLGHGGMEAILLGVFGFINFVILLGLRAGYFQGILASVSPEELTLVDAQIEALFGVTAPLAVYGALERLFTVMLHLAASLLVLQAVVRRQWLWLIAGILWHAVIDGSIFYIYQTWGIVWSEFVLGLLSFASVGLVFWLRQSMPKPIVVVPQPLPDLRPLTPLSVSPDSLERSKYSG